MDKVLKIHQITSKTNAIAIKNHFWAQNGALLQVIKRHGAKWCPAISQFEFPLQNTGNLLKDLKEFDDNIIIKDVPSSEIRSILFQTNAVNPRRPSYVSYNYSNRNLVYDPQLLQRYEYIRKLLMPSAKQLANHYVNGKNAYKKVLVICWQNNLTQWQNELAERYKIDCIEVDYQDLNQHNTISNTPLIEHEIHILTYEKMMALHISKIHIEKFHSIICDDCERWFQGICGPSSIDSLSSILTKILKDYHSSERELILTTGTLTLEPAQLFQICHLLRPRQFGNPLRREIDYSCNDASWMKKRYLRDNKFTRELLQLLSSTALINLTRESHYKKTSRTGFNMEIRMPCPMGEETSAKVNQLRMRYKHINQSAVENSIQSDRLKNSYQLSEASRTDESRYLKELRELMVMDKLPFLTRHLYYLTKELGQRTILLLETVSILERVERFLNEQNVSYLVYEISCEELKRGSLSYLRFNTLPSLKLCILVRDKLVQEYRKSKHEWERELEAEMQREAERELGLQRGQLFELAMHQRVRLGNPLLQRGDMIDLPKISTARHLVIFDTHWYEFSPQKEDIISNILDAKLHCYQQEEGELASRPTCERKMDLIRHYFTTIYPRMKQQPLDKLLIQRYSNNLKAYYEEEQQLQSKDTIPTLEEFTKELLQGESQRCKRKKVLTEVYDIDEEFDQFQYENMKAMQRESEEDSNSRPRYNTTLPEGIVELTPFIPYSSSKDYKLQPSEQAIEIVPQTDDADQVDYIDEQPFDDQSECEGEFNLRDYLVQPLLNTHLQQEQQPPEKPEQVPLQDQQDHPAQPNYQNQQESDDSIVGICLNLQEKGVMKEEVQPDMEITFNKEDYPHRQKLTIYEPPQFIEIEDDSRPSPIPISTNDTGHNAQRRVQNQLTSLPPTHHQRTTHLLDANGHKKRQKPVAGFSLYGPKANKQKIIAPKYMELSIRLTPHQSSFKV